MPRRLKVLILEDQPADAELMVDALRRGGFDPAWERVETQEAYVAHLTPDLDVILVDCALLQSNAMEALRHLQTRDLDIPFVVVTGAVKAESAVACLKQGADEYVLKDQLERLGPAVERALEAKILRDERRAARRDARISTRQWRAAFEAISDPLFLLDAGGRIVRCNQATVDFIGQPRGEIIGRRCCELLREESEVVERCPYSQTLESQERASRVWQKEERWLETTVDPIVDEDGYLIGFVHLLEDITEQKQAEEAVRRRARELELLNRAGQAFNASLDLDEVLGTVLEEVRRVLDVAGCSIWLRDSDTDALICRQASGPQGDTVRGWRLAPGEGIVGWVVSHGTSSIVADAQRDERHFEDVDEQTGLGLRSILTVPLRSEGDTIGALQAVDDTSGRFNAGDAALLKSLAASATLAIQKAQMYERAQDEIAERRRTEAALREAEARYRTLFEETPIGLYRTTPEGEIMEANPALAETLGYSDRESLLESNALDFYVNQEDRKRRLEVLDNHDAWRSVKVRLRRRDGQIIWVQDTGRAIRDDLGQIRYYDGALREITKRKRAEEQAHFQASLLEAVGEAVMATDPTGRVIYWNQAAEELYGWSEEEVLGRNVLDVTPALGSEERAGEIMERLKTGERWTGDFRVQRRDGTAFHALVTNTPVQDEDGNLTAIIGVSRDITKLREIQEELERRAVNQRAINEFAIDLASAERTTDLYTLIAERLKAITNAVAVGVSVYDDEEQALLVEHVAADGGLISRINDILDQEIVGIRSPVSEKTYARIASEIVGTASDLSEVTFGKVPKPVAVAVQRAFGIDRFIGLGLVDRGEVMGTAVVVFRSGQPTPSDEVLQTFARVAAASLRQRQAEETLRRVSQERQVLLDLVPVGISITDEEGQIVDANRMSEEILGIAVAEHQKRRYDGEVWDIIRPDGSPMPSEEYASVRALEDQRIVRNVEMGIVNSEDEITWIRVSAAPIPLKGYGVAIAYADVTKRKHIEETLRESEEKFRALAEHNPDIIARFDKDLRYLYVSPAVSRYVELTPEELIGKTHEELGFVSETVETWEAPIRRAFDTGKPQTFEFEFESLQGRTVFEGRIAPEVGADGRVETVLSAVRDITEQCQAEEALRESERRFRQTFEHAASGMAIVDPEGFFSQVNQRFCDMLGYSREELVGRAFQDVTYPQDRDVGLQVFRTQLAGEQDHEHFEKRFVRRDGRVVWALMSTAMVRDSQGSPLYQISQIQDISKRHEAEKALEQRLAELALLNEIGNQITRALGLETVLESAVEIVQRSFCYHNVAVLTLDQDEQRLTLSTVAGRFADVMDEGLRTDLEEGLIGWVARHGETALVNDVEADPRYINYYPDGVYPRSELSVPIRIADDVVGVLDVQSEELDAFKENDVMVMETVADQIAVALENSRLYKAERAARQQLRDLASHLQNTREEERTRIAREIHDEFGQTMTALKMDLVWLAKRLPQDQPDLLRKADAMSDTIDETLENVRRIASELRPGILDDLGLAAAIEWQAETFSERSGIVCELHLDEEGDRLDRQLATALFRILQEALTNVARHAGARRVRVDLDVAPTEVTLTVADDGRGITEKELTDGASLGLMGMRERAHTLGGSVGFEGDPKDGTTVVARIPRQRHETRR